jgi:hypothetical protein
MSRCQRRREQEETRTLWVQLPHVDPLLVRVRSNLEHRRMHLPRPRLILRPNRSIRSQVLLRARPFERRILQLLIQNRNEFLRVEEEVAVELLVLAIFALTRSAFSLNRLAPAESEEVDDVEVEVGLARVAHTSEVVLIKLLLRRLLGVGEFDVGVGGKFGELSAKVSGGVELAVKVGVGELLLERSALDLILLSGEGEHDEETEKGRKRKRTCSNRQGSYDCLSSHVKSFKNHSNAFILAPIVTVVPQSTVTRPSSSSSSSSIASSPPA